MTARIHPHPGDCKLGRLATLRWLLLGLLGATWLAAETLLGIRLPPQLMLAAAALLPGSNLLLIWRAPVSRRAQGGLILAVLLLDTALLTALLFFTGGAHNPFSTFYLLLVSVAAILLPGGGIWWVAAASAAGFALQFLSPFRLACHSADVFDISFDLHLQGMFAAQALCGLLLAWFVSSLGRGLRKLEAALAAERALAEKRRQLTAIATLAAGVAHEIATPLSTISLAAESLAAQNPGSEDAALIQREVARCRAILGRVNMDASRADSEAAFEGPADLASLPDRVRQALPPADAARARFSGFAESGMAACSADLLAQSLLALVSNALAASPGAVEVECARAGGTVSISVSDRGPGLPAAVSARFAEPFLSGRVDGPGLGLGLFLARMFAHSAGGSLAAAPREGGGTRVTLTLPAAP